MMPNLQTFDKQGYPYTRLFCEENIWQLCKSLISQGIPAEQLNVLLLSNTRKQIILFNQKSVDPGLSLTYDYHVILKYCPDNHHIQVFDFDSHLPFPIDWKIYQHASFPDPASLQPGHNMTIREIPASEYLECFSSNRLHMAHLPKSQHPEYECIQAKDSNNTIDLTDYLNMDKAIKGTSKLYPYNHLIE